MPFVFWSKDTQCLPPHSPPTHTNNNTISWKTVHVHCDGQSTPTPSTNTSCLEPICEAWILSASMRNAATSSMCRRCFTSAAMSSVSLWKARVFCSQNASSSSQRQKYVKILLNPPPHQQLQNTLWHQGIVYICPLRFPSGGGGGEEGSVREDREDRG